MFQRGLLLLRDRGFRICGVKFLAERLHIRHQFTESLLGENNYAVRYFFLNGDDATGISNVDANVDANEAIYNLAGQRINKFQKGINIINGKKILK